jgi:hypothetical protein
LIYANIYAKYKTTRIKLREKDEGGSHADEEFKKEQVDGIYHDTISGNGQR